MEELAHTRDEKKFTVIQRKLLFIEVYRETFSRFILHPFINIVLEFWKKRDPRIEIWISIWIKDLRCVRYFV